ncbi:cation:proton antiporter [Candidatus Micrarchaeota archaeon]|nr:cation:proton antiporter [Candidatus Micrarchaeota archaeon]
MEAANLILDFLLVALFASFAGIISSKLNLPFVALLLAAGLALGPSFLNLVDYSSISTFADLGAVLLLFLIGVEFSLSKLLSLGSRAVFGSFLLILLTFLVMYEISILLSFNFLTSLFVSAMFSLSSTSIIIKILEQKNLLERTEVPTLIAILIIEDLVAVFFLTFFSDFSKGITSHDFITSFLFAFGALAFAYVVIEHALRFLSKHLLNNVSTDTIVLFSFSLGVGLSSLAAGLGLAPAIGAFLGGSLTGALPKSNEVEHSLRSFNLIFSSFFFISIGMLIQPSSIVGIIIPSSILILAFMVTVFLATAFSFFLITSNGRSSVFAGLALLPLGEFSLLIAKESVGLVPLDLVGLASVGVLITSTISSFALDHRKGVFGLLERLIPPGVLLTIQNSSAYFNNVLAAFEPQGRFTKVFLSELNLNVTPVFVFLGAVLFYWQSQIHLSFPVVLFDQVYLLSELLFYLIILVSIYPLVRILLSLKKLFDVLSSIFSQSTPLQSRTVFLRNLFIAGFLFVIFANFSFLMDFLKLPSVFNLLSFLFVALSIFFLWSAIRAVSFGLSLNEGRFINLSKERVHISQKDLIFIDPKEDPSSPKKSVLGRLKIATGERKDG